jgi:hypothetical protein
MRAPIARALGALIAFGTVASCAADARHDDGRVGPELTASEEVATRAAALRERFRARPGLDGVASGVEAAPPTSTAALPPGVATAFVPVDDGRVRAVVPPAARRAERRPARVELPARADGFARVTDEVSGMSVRFALRGAAPAALATADGLARYAGALGGADVWHRPSATGTEDFVVFEQPPAREEVVYDVDVSGAAGLRLVEDTLELVDDTGRPRLRADRPFVVDARGERVPGRTTLEGCAFDADPRAPFDRPVTAPGAARCALRVTWTGARYPAILDPSWSTTGKTFVDRLHHTTTLLPSGALLSVGSFVSNTYQASAELFDGKSSVATTKAPLEKRGAHTATLLPNGKVLVAGGFGVMGTTHAAAEIYDGAIWTAVGPMAGPRANHTATLLPTGEVLLVGGYVATPGIFVASAELFDGVSSFTPAGTLKLGRRYHTATLLGSGKVLVAGGQVGANAWTAAAELYDPATKTFSTIAPMGAARARHSATRLPSGEVLLAGGAMAGGPLASAELFDGVGAFAPASPLVTARAGHTATLLASGRVLLVGGTDGAPMASAETYDLTKTFAATATLAHPRELHTATLLPTGEVVVIGGRDGLATVKDIERFAALLPNTSPCGAAADCASGVCVGGTCKTVLGAACQVDAECTSGACADGVCCNGACSGACDVCAHALGATVDGACTPLTKGATGSPVCGGGLVCDGADGACPVDCASDDGCTPDRYCAAGGTCEPRRALGEACAPALDCAGGACRVCASGHCVDGVCCDGACDGTCLACAGSLKQSGADGACGPAKQYTNPHGDLCPKDPGDPCGPDGTCNGAGACNPVAKSGAPCGDGATCDGDVLKGGLCDGGGACVLSPTGVDCAPFRCAEGACTTTCATSGDCASGAFCDGDVCRDKRSGPDAPCENGGECASGICADGFCCDRACDGRCEACGLDGHRGTCVPVVGAPFAGHGACPAAPTDAPCQASVCDGASTTSCAGFVGPSVTCAEATCQGGAATGAGVCGDGSCHVPEPVACGAYACGATECKDRCEGDGDCAEGVACDRASGKCVSGATCAADGHTALDAAGAAKDCAPYLCVAGACGSSCGTIDDCVAPNVCDASHRCAPRAEAAEEGGGCAARPPRSGGGWAAALVALAVAALGARARTPSARRSPARRPGSPSR